MVLIILPSRDELYCEGPHFCFQVLCASKAALCPAIPGHELAPGLQMLRPLSFLQASMGEKNKPPEATMETPVYHVLCLLLLK